MEKIFTFVIEENDYVINPKIERTFEDLFGKWTVMIKSCSFSLGGYVAFKPKLKYPESLMEKIKIKISFQNTYYSTDIELTYIPRKSSFVFCTYAQGIENDIPIYLVEIKIDASSLPIPSEYKELSVAPSTTEYSEKMYEDGKFADITIKTKDGREIKAHNFFLSRSKVFDTMLNTHDSKEAQKKIIEIEDIDHDVLVEMIRYLYTDEIPKIEEMALDMLIAANKYDIPGLVDECENYLAKNVSIESFAEILIVADLLKIQRLKDAAIKYVVDNLKTVFATDGWKRIKENNMPLAMEVMENFVLKIVLKE